MMCWTVDFQISMKRSTVSVAGCLGYDVLVLEYRKLKLSNSFSCWLFRL
ncbi:hypothetical protein BSPWISOX_2263 [uncultured Gammaproteobacteria bacterium]|nr:hypothetical protein BSPWISOX_2263 [uncultured Gammaproteobacteria bacterium]